MTKNNKHENANDPSKDAVDNRIAAVRDLIFGENIQQYEVNFDEVYEKIAKLQKDTENKLAELAKEVDKKVASTQKNSDDSVDKLRDEYAKKLAKLEDAMADRKKLGKALEKIAQMLQA